MLSLKISFLNAFILFFFFSTAIPQIHEFSGGPSGGTFRGNYFT
jgi:hypothetical protein